MRLQVTGIGGTINRMESQQYFIYMKDERGVKVEFEVLGIKTISSYKNKADMETKEAIKLFPWVDKRRMKCPGVGTIDILIGFDYAGFHPQRIEGIKHLVLLENRFGYTIAGSHEILKQNSECNEVKHAVVLHTGSLERFYTIENLGVSCNPQCGSCKCGKCQIGGKNMSIKEEQEYKLIESNIEYQHDKQRYIASYPWIKDPHKLPDNRSLVEKLLVSNENKLLKDREYATTYQKQMEDMIDRKVARKVSEEELARYNGPKFYLSHFAVSRPESKTSPHRIVFNSSRKYNGHCLNDYLAKGPSLLKNLLGVLLRFRRDKVGFIGDVSKMFHSIDIPLFDQMTHLYLWRDMQTRRISAIVHQQQ